MLELALNVAGISGDLERRRRKLQFVSPTARRISTRSLAMLKDERLAMMPTGFQLRSILLEAYEGLCSSELKNPRFIESYRAQVR